MEKGKLFEIALLGTLVALLAIMGLLVSAGHEESLSQWKLPLNSTPYMYVGDNNSLYVFDNNDIYAINPDGNLAWKTTIPSNWRVINDWDVVSSYEPDPDGSGLVGFASGGSGPVFTADNGIVYVYLCANSDQYGNPIVPDMLAAVEDGQILWEREVPVKYNGELWVTTCPDLEVRDNRIYLFYMYNVTVFDTAGSLLYKIPGVSDRPAIDEAGNIYVIEAFWPDWLGKEKITYAAPSQTLRAYFPNGSLRWAMAINDTVARRELQGGYIAGVNPFSQTAMVTLPIYANHTLLVPLTDGLTAIDTNGSASWTAHLGVNVTLNGDVPFDSEGNAYMTERIYDWEFNSDHNLESLRYVYVIARDGSYSITDPHHFYPYDEKRLLALEDGTGYYGMSPVIERDLSGPGIILPANLTAVDLRSGEDLWTLNVPLGLPDAVTVDEANVDELFTRSEVVNIREDNKNHPGMKDNRSLTYSYNGQTEITVLPADDLVYVSYNGYSYDYPIFGNGVVDMWDLANSSPMSVFMPVFDKTTFYSTSGLCAIDRNNGTLLWQKPTGSFVTGMAANNSTLYYSTKSGGVSGVAVAAGMTAIAAALLFIRVFVLGTVSRAKSRLEQNENRLAIVKCVQERPGSTMYEIARELDMNLGTMRYHLLILGINHKVREHRDGKYVRYFPGSQAFTPDELEVMSLLRREPVRRLMLMLSEKPGVSNAEIARALEISESAVSNYMRDLSAKGFVAREVSPSGRTTYVIRKERLSQVERSLEAGGPNIAAEKF